jgi:hypothetical protein
LSEESHSSNSTFSDAHGKVKDKPEDVEKYADMILERIQEMARATAEEHGKKDYEDAVERLVELGMDIKQKLEPFAPRGVGCTGLDLLQYAIQDDIEDWDDHDFRIFTEYYACAMLGLVKQVEDNDDVQWVITQSRAMEIIDYARRAEQLMGAPRKSHAPRSKGSHHADAETSEVLKQDDDEEHATPTKLLPISIFQHDVEAARKREHEQLHWETASTGSVAREIDDVKDLPFYPR